jgi:hypothetical protein
MSPGVAQKQPLREPEAAEPADFSDRVAGDLTALDDFARELRGRTAGQGEDDATRVFPRRINADEATGEKDLAKLVLALVDLVRRLMERHAVRRVNAGSLSDAQVERMGETFLKLDQRMAELRSAFGVTAEELTLSLGSLGDLLPESHSGSTAVPRLSDDRQGAERQ